MSRETAVVALLERGISPTEIAKKLQTNRNFVYRVKRRSVICMIDESELREALRKLDIAYRKFEASASVVSYGHLIEARERYEAARKA